jgi:preprotein translocase subunit YajC
MSLKNLAFSLAVTAATAMPLLAQEGGEDSIPAPGLFGGGFLPMVILMIVIFYFVLMRPEQKRQKERQKMLSALKKGDRVLTIGGIHGVIQNVKETSYVIKSGGEGAVLEISKSAVQALVTDTAAAKETVKETDEKVKGQA